MRFSWPVAVMFFCAGFGLVAPAPVVAQSWQSTHAPNNAWRSPACSADGRKLVAKVGTYLLGSTNWGVTWFTNGAPSNSWTSVACSADGQQLVASAAAIFNPAGGGAHGGPIYISTNSGATWSVTSAPSNQWACVASSADGARLVAAAAYNYSNTAPGLIYSSTNFGVDWNPTGAPTNNWNGVASSADGTRLIASCGGAFAGTNSALFISADAGATWAPNSISDDHPANDAPFWISVSSSADGSCLLAIRELGFYNSTNVPRVYASTNCGGTWTSTNLPTTGAGFTAVSGNGKVMMASLGRLFLSTNGGAMWFQRNVPSSGQQFDWSLASLAASADGNRLYVAMGGNAFGQPDSIYTSYTLPRPQLELTPTLTNLTLRWTLPATNFVVQQAADLNGAGWQTLSNAPVFDAGTLQNRVELSVTNSSGFFRLVVGGQ